MSEYAGSRRSASLDALFVETPKSTLLDIRKQPEVGKPLKKSSPQQKAMLHRLMAVHPVDHLLMGASGGAAFAESASQRAQRLGFTKPADVLNHLDLMVMFGHRFDIDPQLPWVGPALSKKSMTVLFESALSYLGVISGDTGNLYIKALLRARKLAPTSLIDRVGISEAEASRLLATLHPEKSRVMGSQMKSMLTLAQALVAEHSKGVRPLYLVLMFLLGSHFETDPRYAWAGTMLRDTQTPEPLRYKNLYAEASSRLRLVLNARGGLETLSEEVR
ncbi:hypothetical protein LXT21_15130 [Myxococcus sp. K38C18041901]|uniref:hypothetical protein n=1 Tax=Myxococcus guangdongensis TaxID=2906760 RepID=UPI0020A6E7C3|nr:hypothetical protein [Myxococcus guangdongensis]MCP3060115.1 hypothetical protein [Myxococcus guangdongensis]